MRHRILAGALALAALAGAAGMVAAQNRADTPTNPFAGNAGAVTAGRNTFNGACSACHGPGASGTERAPALSGSLKHGSEEYDIFQTIRNGVPGTAMPAFDALPPEEIWRLVTFIKSLSGEAAPARGAPIVAAAAGDAVNGRRVFFGKGDCASCHEVQGQGSVVGPDLSAVGGAADLRRRVLHQAGPGQRGGGPAPAPFRMVDVQLKNGQRLSGVLKARDSVVLHLQTRDGAWRLLTNDQVQSVTPTPNGGPPTDVAQRLNASEIDDVVAYLSRQRGRDFDQTVKAQPAPVLAAERLVKSRAEPQNWPTYWGDYAGHHFSELDQINPTNVARLQARWIGQTPYDRPIQSSPVVVDGIMYTSGAPGDVYAFDARTGAQLWKFHRNQDKRNPYQINPSNRGVAVLGGRVFFNTLDNNLIALDAHSGRPLWEKNLGDTMLGMTLTGAPLAVGDMIVVGMSGGEGGVRGFLDAYDAATGERRWRFNTIPGPGEPGNETWLGDSWMRGGGATWLTGSYDPELDLVYWSVGNPGPDFDPNIRKGDNLYSNSVIALNSKTGKLAWHYQFTPNDSHDWDSVQDMVLADRMIDGRMRKLLLHADRNGFFYVLDRTNGKFISGDAYVTQNWNDGFDANGRPKVRPESVATLEGVRISPGFAATNFQAPSYDTRSGAFFLAFTDAEGFANYEPQEYVPGQLYYARGNAPRPPPSREAVQGIMAWDAHKRQKIWTFPLTRGSLSAGVLGTRGGLVFAASSEGWFYALDANTGRPLWRFNAGSQITASPISYAVDGRQYVAVSAGAQVISFALPE
jgi:PQQ-dependent dehydrogenase (methanol/ethanol family)